MKIFITNWGLDTYLSLKGAGVITKEDIRRCIHPDILLLHERATNPRFRDSSFWGPAQDAAGVEIPHGYKMKWHNMGNGLVQLRLCIALVGQHTYLCHGYVKTSPQGDRRESSKLKERIRLIGLGLVQIKGELP